MLPFDKVVKGSRFERWIPW